MKNLDIPISLGHISNQIYAKRHGYYFFVRWWGCACERRQDSQRSSGAFVFGDLLPSLLFSCTYFRTHPSIIYLPKILQKMLKYAQDVMRSSANGAGTITAGTRTEIFVNTVQKIIKGESFCGE